jgi:hypothetical protein
VQGNYQFTAEIHKRKWGVSAQPPGLGLGGLGSGNLWGVARMHAGATKMISSSFSLSARVWGRRGLLLALRGEWRVGDLLGGFPRCWVFPPSPYSLLSHLHIPSPQLPPFPIPYIARHTCNVRRPIIRSVLTFAWG